MPNRILKTFLILDLITLNIVIGYLFIRLQIPASGDQGKTVFQLPTNQTVDVCGTDCQNQIDQRLKVYDTRIRSLETSEGITPAPTLRPRLGATPKPMTKTVQYVTIPGSGSTTANTWQDISGTEFYFDPSDYPGLVEIYFEANMKLFNGNGMAYVRLLDVTHGIGVQGSEVSTNSQIDTIVVSGKVSFWAGRNLIRIQAKSLTADTTIYSYGRLKVVTEN